jgi:hypothetical protein
MSELENLPLDINKINDTHIKSRDEAIICVVSQIRARNWSPNEPFIIKLLYELRNNKYFTNIFKFAIDSFILANLLVPRRKWSVFNTWTSWKPAHWSPSQPHMAFPIIRNNDMKNAWM